MRFNEEINCNRDYWEKILGKENCMMLQKEDEKFPEDRGFEDKYKLLDALYYDVLHQSNGWEEYKLTVSFGKFYCVFGRLAVNYAETMQIKGLKKLKDNILNNLYKKIEWIPLRVLIEDINQCRLQGVLKGNDDREEYKDYEERFLSDPVYIEKLFSRYPEMKKLLFLQIIQVVEYIQEIAEHAIEDRKALAEQFFAGRCFKYIEQITCGLSDAHKDGKTVSRIVFDTGETLFYKPRSLKKEILFGNIYEKFCENAGVSFKWYRVLDKGSYGWESLIRKAPCTCPEEVGRYFARIGILLFLCYDMNGSDIHGENILANGEYPMLLDLETLPGHQNNVVQNNAEDCVQEKLRTSVLHTGILPVNIWGKGGQGIIVNALHRKGRETISIRVPKVCRPQSSDIHIGYQDGKLDISGSLPECAGMDINPLGYAKEICTGFQGAYRFMLENRGQIEQEMLPLFLCDSRYLIRHTQQYGMYLRTSLYPDFLEKEEKRRLFLHVLDRPENGNIQIESYEREALYQMDIPVFTIKGNSRTLYDGYGNQYPYFLKASMYEFWKKRQGELGEEDLNHQLRLIQLSLSILADRHTEYKRTFIDRDDSYSVELRKQAWIKRAADSICNMAVIYEENEDIGFYGLRLQKSGSRNIAPIGMYLYDGIAGVAVALAAVCRICSLEIYDRIWRMTIQKLFRYTDAVLSGQKETESKYTGAFEGEGSIVHAYVLLYQITKEDIFLEYARRHCRILDHMGDIACLDMLSGHAGMVVVLIKLYGITGEANYLQKAVELGEILWSQVQVQETGCGWVLPGMERPLAGLAHGNSGLLLAYGYLAEITQDGRYHSRIYELLAYENSLYDEQIKNWKDLRHPGGIRTNHNAWCHGAAGILLSRMKLKQLRIPELEDWINGDIKRCRNVFCVDEEPEEMCLCHGLAGLYWVLNKYLREETSPVLETKRNRFLCKLLDRLEAEEILPQEKYDVSFMTGISGIVTILSETGSCIDWLW